MPIVLEEDILTSYLVGYLEADTELMAMLNGGINAEVFTDTTASPFVRLERLDGNDLMVIGLARVWVDTAWHIWGALHWTGSGQPDRTDVNAIGARLDTLLHDHEAVTAYHHIHGFREEPEPSPLVTTQDGQTWLHSGGVYRLRVAAV